MVWEKKGQIMGMLINHIAQCAQGSKYNGESWKDFK